MKKIICWGDSITRGMGMTATTNYPAYLQSFVGSKYTVLNAGSSGEKSSTIAARKGAYDVFVYDDIVFAAGEKSVVIGRASTNSGFVLGDGTAVKLNSQWEAFTNDVSAQYVYINDVEYKLTLAIEENTGETVFVLNREDASSALTIEKSTKAVFSSAINSQGSYCEIFYVGANDGPNDGFTLDDAGREYLVNRYKDLIASHGNDCYLIILPQWTHFYDNALIKAFGDKVVNLKSKDDILRVMNLLGITPTAEDMTVLNNDNVIPPSLCYNNEKYNVHLNKDGYYYMATMIYEKGVALGYWN